VIYAFKTIKTGIHGRDLSIKGTPYQITGIYVAVRKKKPCLS
jgi:hypothetical protein